MFKRIAALLLALLLTAGTVLAQETTQTAEFYEEMPPALRVTQTLEIEKVEKDITVRRAYPKSANAQVDAQIRALVDELTSQAIKALDSFEADTAALRQFALDLARRTK